MRFLLLWIVLVVTFLVIDLIWLGVIMKNFYSAELGELARRQGSSLAPRWSVAVLVYLLIPTSLLLFVRPLLGPSATNLTALGWGALYGLTLYGVYDLSNLAVLDKWTVRMTIADMLWGSTICGLCSVVMQQLLHYLKVG